MAAWLFNWYLVLTPEFFGPITFISIVSNTGSMMAPFGLAPHFFRYNRIQPFYNGAMLFRYILSGAYPKVGINVSILLGESALMLAIMYITTWFRQTTLLLGITDVPGWHRSSIFFHGNIPYYKTAAPEEPEPLVISKREFVVSEHGGDSLSLREGNLGI
ncbi:hypothetical protein GGF43_003031 [Coemansia sp. RSA 2618]|nr:hypothetical protein GGF43_003031 [Coemansia sp. RSA 2618]